MLLKRAATRRAYLGKSRAAAVVKIRGETALRVYARVKRIEILTLYEPTPNKRVSPNVQNKKDIPENRGKRRKLWFICPSTRNVLYISFVSQEEDINMILINLFLFNASTHAIRSHDDLYFINLAYIKSRSPRVSLEREKDFSASRRE